MANLEDLISKIKEDGKKRAEEIVKEAKQRESDLIEEYKKRAEEEGKKLINKAEEEAKVIEEKAVSNAKMKVRNLKLEAKQYVLNTVFDEALKVLDNMGKGQFLDFVKASIIDADLDGDEVISFNADKLPQVSSDFIDSVNRELVKKGKAGNIRLNDQPADIKNGFVLSKGGIEINYTFEEILNVYRDELEQKITALLF